MANSIANPFITVRTKSFIKLLILISLGFSTQLCLAQDIQNILPLPKSTDAKTKTDVIRTVVTKKKARTFVSYIHHTFKFGISLWGESVPLQTTDGRSENVDVKYSGFSLGYEPTYKWLNFEAWVSAQALFLQGQAVAEGNSIIYQNKVKTSIPFLTDIGVGYHPHQNVNLGLGVGILLHTLSLEPPTSVVTTYDFKYSTPLKIIYTFKLVWLMSENLALEQKIMTFAESYIDTGWNVSLNYIY